jgi:glycine C-acetyltransferase
MEGDIADLPAIRGLCDEFGAMLIVDDSHGHGVMGRTGRGTHEHYGMGGPRRRRHQRQRHRRGRLLHRHARQGPGRRRGRLRRGLRRGIELLIQRGRPTLFSNALPATIACSANKAIEI